MINLTFFLIGSAFVALLFIGLMLLQHPYRYAFEASPDPMLVIHRLKGNVLYANEAACTLFGYERRALKGMRAAELGFGAAWAEAQGPVGHFTLKSKTRGEIDAEASSYPFRWALRSALTVTLRNVRPAGHSSEHVLSNGQRAGAVGVPELASYIAHDLRNPLSVILAYAHLLQRLAGSGTLDPRTIKQIEGIRRASERMDFMIQNLSDLVKLEHGRFKLELTDQQLGPVLTEAVESVMTMAGEKSIKIELDIAEGEAQIVNIDRKRLVHALRAILHNAVKFSANESKVSVAAHLTDSGIEIAIRDSGPGIAPEVFPHLYDCSWRNTTVGRVHSGMSLCVTRQIIEAHGGELSAANSNDAKGAEFRLRLPLKQAAGLPASSVSTVPGTTEQHTS